MALPAPQPEVQELNQVLHAYAQPGILYEKLEAGKVRCFSCGHRCVIPEGKAGICLVRYNEGGTLYVPHGYVGALQLDPVEKKPFFHAYPGSLAMSFGMLGCDYHCGYCFRGDTRVMTDQGPIPIEEIFHSTSFDQDPRDPHIRYPDGFFVYTHTGQLKEVRAAFAHSYKGRMLKITPAFCPPIYCTPDHKLLALPKPKKGKKPDLPTFMRAQELTTEHCLAIPKNYSFSEDQWINVPLHLSAALKPFRVGRHLPLEVLDEIYQRVIDGQGPAKISRDLSLSADHAAVLRKQILRGVFYERPAKIILEGEKVRLSKEHAPGIPGEILLDRRLASLFGYYCAEGNVFHWRDRVHAGLLTFTFGLHEEDLANEVKNLLEEVFGVKPKIQRRRSTIAVVADKASLMILFKRLCGMGAANKKVPSYLFNAHREVVEAFLESYVRGDGYLSPEGSVEVVTVSEELAYGVAWLVLKNGHLPFLRSYKTPTTLIEGRRVQRQPLQFRVRWWKDSRRRRCWENDHYYFVPLRKIEKEFFEGEVYNIEVQDDHSFVANFIASKNCQNWFTSQSLRDPASTARPIQMTPHNFAKLAKEEGARIVTSTYNEPLITSEWAVEVFQAAKKAGLVTSYVSNGNGTPEVLEYIRPWVDLYKVDLKGFQDKHYRELGGVLSVVLDTIERLYKMGFWLEIVTLIVPGFNDSEEELRGMAKFLVGISKDIPWHVTAFHQDYKMRDHNNTDIQTLIQAYDIGKEEGLNYVYPGNRPGQVGNRENTYCPSCKTSLVERFGFQVLGYNLKPGGRCPKCDLQIPGRWD